MSGQHNHDCAVAFCVDRKYFPFALFMIWQIAHLNPHRRFDFVIASQDDLALPDWARPYGIVLHRSGALPPEAEVARFFGSMAPLLRILLARELGDRYRRIIYMDSDMYVVGGDLGRLMDIDIGPHPLAAVLDCQFFLKAAPHPDEYRDAGIQALPYLNSGFLVIDTKAYRDQEVERRSFEVCTTYPANFKAGDQTLINLALQGKFAQLAPCWNWHLDAHLPRLTHLYPVFNHHFVWKNKPNRVSNTILPVRFNQAYRDFMTLYVPEALSDLAAPPEARPLNFREHLGMLLSDLSMAPVASAMIARYPDPYRALL
ncbi:MAG: hypothetical protein B7Z10_08665 [Rhodobacterales bacterium 32-66-7]|nr:MAG: hypothetical protein B7Z10_08665 [Rhodobacterales bacterium 32-66-7]